MVGLNLQYVRILFLYNIGMKSKADGELELEVMDILWKNNKASVAEVHSKIKKHREIAYTTVATVLQRLVDKEMVERKQEKNYLVFYPTVSKKNYTSNIIKNFFQKIVHNFGDVAISSFAENIESLPTKDRKKLLELLNQHE